MNRTYPFTRLLSVSAALLLAAATRPGLALDWRQEAGTASPECAAQLSETRRLRSEARLPEALAAAQAARKADPACVQAVNEESRLLRALGRDEEAARNLRGMLDPLLSDPTRRLAAHAESMLMLARAYGELGEDQKSLFWIHQLQRMDNGLCEEERWSYHADMARARERLGDLTSAMFAGEAAQDASPRRDEEAFQTPFLKKYAFQETLHWMEDEEVSAPPPPVPAWVPTQGKPALSLWKELGAAIPSNQVFSCVEPAWLTGEVLAAWADQPKATLVNTASGQASTIALAMPGPAAGLAATGDGWVAWTAGQPVLYQLGRDGTLVREHEISTVPTAAAACPGLGKVHLIIQRELHVLNLGSGVLKRAHHLADRVAVDPWHLRLALLGAAENETDFGEDYFLALSQGFAAQQPRATRQATLRICLVDAGNDAVNLTLRSHAATTAGSVSFSGDGEWILPTGGFLPEPGGPVSGARLFQRRRLEAAPGVYRIPDDGQPVLGGAVNPVTQQVALWGAQGLRVAWFGNPDAGWNARGSFAAPGAWSADGKALVLTRAEKRGLVILRGEQTPEQAKAAAERLEQLRQRAASIAETVARGNSPRPDKPAAPEVARLADWSPGRDLPAARTRLTRALGAGPATALPRWIHTSLYGTSPEDAEARGEVINLHFTPASAAGTAVFKANNKLAGREPYAPALYITGVLRQTAGDTEAAAGDFLKAVRLDRGRTDLTTASLARLGLLYTALNREAEAADCLATGLELDRAHEMTYDAARPLLALAKLPEPVSPGPGLPGKWDAAPRAPPYVNAFPARRFKQWITPEDVADFACNSLVTLHTRLGDQTAVNIGWNGLALTTAAAVEPADQTLTATWYSHQTGNPPVRMATSPARVAWVDRARDLALVRLHAGPLLAQPMTLAPHPPRVTSLVFALTAPAKPEKEPVRAGWTKGKIGSRPMHVNGREVIGHSADIDESQRCGVLVNPLGEIVGLISRAPDLSRLNVAVTADELRKALNLPE